MSFRYLDGATQQTKPPGGSQRAICSQSTLIVLSIHLEWEMLSKLKLGTSTEVAGDLAGEEAASLRAPVVGRAARCCKSRLKRSTFDRWATEEVPQTTSLHLASSHPKRARRMCIYTHCLTSKRFSSAQFLTLCPTHLSTCGSGAQVRMQDSEPRRKQVFSVVQELPCRKSNSAEPIFGCDSAPPWTALQACPTGRRCARSAQ